VLLAAVLNAPTLGGGLLLAPEARLDDGMLEVVMIEMLRTREVLALIPRLLITGELRSKRAVRMRVAKIQIDRGERNKFSGGRRVTGKKRR